MLEESYLRLQNFLNNLFSHAVITVKQSSELKSTGCMCCTIYHQIWERYATNHFLLSPALIDEMVMVDPVLDFWQGIYVCQKVQKLININIILNGYSTRNETERLDRRQEILCSGLLQIKRTISHTVICNVISSVKDCTPVLKNYITFLIL